MVTKAQNLLIRIPKDLIKIECNTTTLALLLLSYDSTHCLFFMNIVGQFLSLRAILFEILRGGGLETNKMYGGVHEKINCMGGGPRFFPVGPPIRISNGIALSDNGPSECERSSQPA